MNLFTLGSFTVDMVSYLSNVTKLLDVYRQSGAPDAIKALWSHTFKGRRYEILKDEFKSVDDVLIKRCPVLRDPRYVCIPIYLNVVPH
jgi:hypothetical protein